MPVGQIGPVRRAISLFDHPAPMTEELIREIETRDDADALKALVEAASVRDQFLRRIAIEVIGRHPMGRQSANVILGALDDPSECVVRAACDVVARWRLNEAHERVVAFLGNASKATRQVALRALAAIWVDADFPLVFGILTNASEIEVRREAAWVLRHRATSLCWRTLFDVFRTDELARHRQWACELAGSFSGPDILQVLRKLSEDVDGHVRQAAMRQSKLFQAAKEASDTGWIGTSPSRAPHRPGA